MTQTKIGPRDVLIVIDVQNDFCKGGLLEVPNGDAVVSPINQAMKCFSNVIGTQDWHPTEHDSFASSHQGKSPYDTIELFYGVQTLWPDHCIQGSDGAKFHKKLDTTRFNMIIRKGLRRGIDSYSAFFENDRVTDTGLSGYLQSRNLRRVFLCGLAGDICVYYSALDSLSQGFATFFLEDACRDVDTADSKAISRESMSKKGIKILNTKDLT